jgi:hypothetical protein
VGKHQISFSFQTYKNRRIFYWPNALGSSPSEDASKNTHKNEKRVIFRAQKEV